MGETGHAETPKRPLTVEGMWQDRAQGNPDGVYNFGMDGGAAHGTPSGEGAALMKSAPEMDAQHHRYLDNQFRANQNPAFQSAQMFIDGSAAYSSERGMIDQNTLDQQK